MIHGKASLTVEGATPSSAPVKPRKDGQRMKDNEFWLLVGTAALAVADIYAALHSIALAGGVGLLVWIVFMLQQHQLRRQEKAAYEMTLAVDRVGRELQLVAGRLACITSQDAMRATVSMARNEARASKG